MDKKVIIGGVAVVAVAAIGYFMFGGGGSGGSCSPEEFQEKMTSLTAKVQEVATSDPGALTALSEKVTAIGADATSDMGAACSAIDELLAELG